MEEFQKFFFSRPLFTIIFRPEVLQVHPYSILTGGHNGRICHILCVNLFKSTSAPKLVWPHWAKRPSQGERAFIVATWQLSLAFINIVSYVCSVHKRMPGLTN